MVSINKKLEIAWKLKDQDKLSDGEYMTLNSELNNCSPEDRNEIDEMVFFLGRYDSYKEKENSNLLF